MATSYGFAKLFSSISTLPFAFRKNLLISLFKKFSYLLLSFFECLLSIQFSMCWLVEISGIEPLASCLQGRRSPSWAIPPYRSAFSTLSKRKWWAQVDSNHRPHDYQSCALASWAMGPFDSYLLSKHQRWTFFKALSKLNNNQVNWSPCLTRITSRP